MLRIRFQLYLIILVLLAFAVYYPILNNRLLSHWDDQWVVMNPYTKAGFTFENIWYILIDFYQGQYAPFNEYLYVTLNSINGYDPFIFHLASLLLHAANTCLVYWLVGKLFKLTIVSDDRKSDLIAFIAAAIFCIHPLNVESVSWMSASKILVYALFYLLATSTFIKYIQTTHSRYYIYTIIFYVFSFLGKEQAVVFPVWLILLLLILIKDISIKKIWKVTWPFFFLSLIFGIVTILSQYPGGAGFMESSNNYPFWQRLIFGSYSFMEYLVKILIPFKLSYLYPFPSQIGDPLPTWLLTYPVIVVILLISFWNKLDKHRVIAIGLAFFTIHIGIALHLIPLSRFVIIADRYAYVSVIGIAAVMAYYLVTLYEVFSKSVVRYLIAVLFVMYSFYLGIYAHKRTYTWYSVDTLKMELRHLLQQRNDFQKF